MKTVDDYLTDLDQDLADATKAFRQAEDLLQRGRRRLVALMGLARSLGLRGDEPRVVADFGPASPPVWADLDGQGYADLNFIRDRDQAAAVAAAHLNQVHRPLSGRVVSGFTETTPKEQPKFWADGMATADLLDLLALAGIDVRAAAKPHLDRLKIDVPPGWPKPMPAAPPVHPNCRCSPPIRAAQKKRRGTKKKP